LKVYSFKKTRTFIAKILIRFSLAYADLALWIAPWLAKEDGAGRWAAKQPRLLVCSLASSVRKTHAA